MIDLTILKNEFAAVYGAPPRIFRAPGRVNLIGEHTDHDEGFVLPMAIDRTVFVAAAPAAGRQIRVKSVNLNESAVIDLDKPYESKKSWTNYVEGTARILEANGGRLRGADLLIHSDIPTGAGLSSSAALETAVGLALSEISAQPIDRRTLALNGQRTEHEYAGVNCGIMDQFVSANAVGGHALLIDCLTLSSEAVPLDTRETVVVICDSNVKHDLASSAYNERRRDYEKGIELLRKFYPHLRHLRELTPAEFERHAFALPEPIVRRARHVVGENERVRRAAALLRAGDLASFGVLMRQSHASLRDDYEVSCAELDYLVECCDEMPDLVLGARLTGGGFGGSIVCLVRRDGLREFERRITADYRRRTKLETQIIVSEAVDGASEVFLET